MPKITIERHDAVPTRDLSLVALVLGDLRDDERSEARAVGNDPFVSAPFLFQNSPAPHVVYSDGEPVFIFGTIPTRPWHHLLWGFGTTQTRRAMPAMTRYGRQTWIPYLFREQAVRRVEVRLPVQSKASIAWLSAVGMRTECIIDDVGVDAQKFVQLAYTSTDFIKAYPKHVLARPAAAVDDSGGRDENQR